MPNNTREFVNPKSNDSNRFKIHRKRDEKEKMFLLQYKHNLMENRVNPFLDLKENFNRIQDNSLLKHFSNATTISRGKKSKKNVASAKKTSVLKTSDYVKAKTSFFKKRFIRSSIPLKQTVNVETIPSKPKFFASQLIKIESPDQIIKSKLNNQFNLKSQDAVSSYRQQNSKYNLELIPPYLNSYLGENYYKTIYESKHFPLIEPGEKINVDGVSFSDGDSKNSNKFRLANTLTPTEINKLNSDISHGEFYVKQPNFVLINSSEKSEILVPDKPNYSKNLSDNDRTNLIKHQNSQSFNRDETQTLPRLKVPQKNEIRFIINVSPTPPSNDKSVTPRILNFMNGDADTHKFLSILKETNKLPKNLTPQNIDTGIKTLALILERLQKEKQEQEIHPTSISLKQSVEGKSRGEKSKKIQSFPQSTDTSTPGVPGIDYPIYSSIPRTDFNCSSQRYKGFFGDPDTNCQVWHYCDLNGGQASFLCPNGTIFSQVALTCDWWFNVKCSSTSQLYVLNERLYKYILPFAPSFPEDYSGPIVDKYLTAKFNEMKKKSN